MDKGEPALDAFVGLWCSQRQHVKLLCAVPGKPQGHCNPALQASCPPAVSFIPLLVHHVVGHQLGIALHLLVFEAAAGRWHIFDCKLGVKQCPCAGNSLMLTASLDIVRAQRRAAVLLSCRGRGTAWAAVHSVVVASCVAGECLWWRCSFEELQQSKARVGGTTATEHAGEHAAAGSA